VVHGHDGFPLFRLKGIRHHKQAVSIAHQLIVDVEYHVVFFETGFPEGTVRIDFGYNPVPPDTSPCSFFAQVWTA